MIDLTIVICTLKKNFYYYSQYPVIIVSPTPSNMTGNIEYIQDKKCIGLGNARQLALNACQTQYILYMSDDNSFHSDTIIEYAIKEMEANKWIGCAFSQRISNEHNYLEKCINIRNKHRFTPGRKSVTGTPFIWNVLALKEVGGFDTKAAYFDDTDIANKLTMKGHQFGYSSYIAYEYSDNAKLSNIYKRFKMYGRSDKGYFLKYYKSWTFERIVKSLLHPLTAEYIPNIYYLPFYIMIVIFRYIGYIK